MNIQAGDKVVCIVDIERIPQYPFPVPQKDEIYRVRGTHIVTKMGIGMLYLYIEGFDAMSVSFRHDQFRKVDEDFAERVIANIELEKMVERIKEIEELEAV